MATKDTSRGLRRCHDTTFRGYANGMLAEIRQYNMLISQTLARIKIDFDSAAHADLIKIIRPNPKRAGANKRWRGAGA